MNPALPLYAGTRPYQQIPFQWSLHRIDARGEVTHAEFLATGRGDPRAELTAALLGELAGESLPVVVYSPFEARVLADLGEVLPRDAAALGALRSRLADLHPVVRRHVYHPGCHGSFSIKAVGPALVPGFGYDDLGEVADGGAASAAFLEIVRLADARDPVREAGLRTALLAYCARDTLALLELHRALRRLAAGGTPSS